MVLDLLLLKKEKCFIPNEELLIDKSEKNLNVTYSINEEFKKGKYKVNLFTDDYKIGSGEFLVK